MSTQANEAYKAWKEQHKVNMAVYTDEQMFTMGFDAREDQVNALIDLVEDLSTRLKKYKTPETLDTITEKKPKARKNVKEKV